MGIQLDPTAAIGIAGGLLLLAFYVFARVRLDYRARGLLTRPVAALQTGYFFIHALCSYLFLDSELTAIASRGVLLGFAVLLMMAGLSAVLASMPFLGRRSFGAKVGQLHTKGVYRFSRNPQLVGSFCFIIGYVLLWPSWTGALWAALWLPISHLMVRAEEEHLASVFGKEYEEYCRRTPRYIGVPKEQQRWTKTFLRLDDSLPLTRLACGRLGGDLHAGVRWSQPVLRRPAAMFAGGILGDHGATEMARNVVQDYLDLLDSQRAAVFAALDGLSEKQIWQRPAPGEWCVGEILSHTVRFFASFLPGLEGMWALCGWVGRLRRHRPYRVEIENVYRRPGFPMWTGFLWTPRHNPGRPVLLAVLRAEADSTHRRVRQFYTGKDEEVLGNIYAYDPAVGVVNLITALKVGVDHDQLHYDDVLKMAASLRAGE